jgi:hypothetical protein
MVMNCPNCQELADVEIEQSKNNPKRYGYTCISCSFKWVMHLSKKEQAIQMFKAIEQAIYSMDMGEDITLERCSNVVDEIRRLNRIEQALEQITSSSIPVVITVRSSKIEY